MNIVERLIVWTVGLGLLYGCANGLRTYALPEPKTTETLVKIGVRGEDAAGHVEQAKPHTDTIGKVHLDAASDDLAKQSEDVKVAQQNAQGERDGYKKIIDGQEVAYKSLQDYYGVWYRKLAIQFVNSAHLIFWIVTIALSLVILLRILSVGPFALTDLGAVLSGAATAICAVFAGPFHWLQLLFDNIHFRRALKAQTGTDANAATLSVVGQPASVVDTSATVATVVPHAVVSGVTAPLTSAVAA